MFEVEKLLIDVFDPQRDEVAMVVVDTPHGEVADTDAWRSRREMAERWHAALVDLGAKRGFRVKPLLQYPATGANNADLPAIGVLDGEEVSVHEALASSTFAIAMTEFSATAPLTHIAKDHSDFRAASMPGVEERMEQTSLAADYGKVASRCQAIAEAMAGAVILAVVFSTGHRCWFDLRHRRAEMDDGFLPRFKEGERIINLPSGETFIVPYEGEFEEVPSWTAGTIPVAEQDELVLFHVVANTVVVVEGDGPAADRFANFFEADPARANIAEVAFGVNDMAEVTGVVLEDEKAGFHWAFGRSDHLGGFVGVDEFKSPETVIHQDIVYAKGNPIQVESAELIHPDGHRVAVISDGEYVL
jgi:leucyl aminopeptidase (aminopeptidase T)